ncbi:hypothetical protein [Pseudoalteromonas xiamenensis]
MKQCIAALLSLVSLSSIAAEVPVIELDGAPVKLTINDFSPITKRFGPRDAIVGYEALIDVNSDSPLSQLIIESDGLLKTKWYAANFGVTTRFYCSGTPVAMSKAFGYRDLRKVVYAEPHVEEIRYDIATCSQLKIEITKDGSLSRQFYTQIESIEFNVSLSGNQQGEAE